MKDVKLKITEQNDQLNYFFYVLYLSHIYFLYKFKLNDKEVKTWKS